MKRLKQEYQWHAIYSEYLETIGTFNGLFVQYLSRKKGGEEDALLSFPQWQKRVNDRKNGIIHKMQCRSFMASKWCEEAMELFCTILNDSDDSNYAWAQTHELVEMVTYQQAKNMLIVCIVDRLNHPMVQRSKSLCPRTSNIKAAKKLAPGTTLTDEELAAQGFERDSFGFLKCMGSCGVVPLALHKKYGYCLSHCLGHTRECIEQQVDGREIRTEDTQVLDVAHNEEEATEEEQVEQEVEREASAATARVQAEVSEGESQLEEEASADERLGSMERAIQETEEEEGEEIAPESEAGRVSPPRETLVEPCLQTCVLSEYEASEHEMDGKQTEEKNMEEEGDVCQCQIAPELLERIMSKTDKNCGY
ncbi:hypothetical protein KEM56_004890 [Ascosphaera pollenicola]|nr:hypothetical protein KEM56_004890 [Ascosphaera pollenicola]